METSYQEERSMQMPNTPAPLLGNQTPLEHSATRKSARLQKKPAIQRELSQRGRRKRRSLSPSKLTQKPSRKSPATEKLPRKKVGKANIQKSRPEPLNFNLPPAIPMKEIVIAQQIQRNEKSTQPTAMKGVVTAATGKKTQSTEMEDIVMSSMEQSKSEQDSLENLSKPPNKADNLFPIPDEEMIDKRNAIEIQDETAPLTQFSQNTFDLGSSCTYTENDGFIFSINAKGSDDLFETATPEENFVTKNRIYTADVKNPTDFCEKIKGMTALRLQKILSEKVSFAPESQFPDIPQTFATLMEKMNLNPLNAPKYVLFANFPEWMVRLQIQRSFAYSFDQRWLACFLKLSPEWIPFCCFYENEITKKSRNPRHVVVNEVFFFATLENLKTLFFFLL